MGLAKNARQLESDPCWRVAGRCDSSLAELSSDSGWCLDGMENPAALSTDVRRPPHMLPWQARVWHARVLSGKLGSGAAHMACGLVARRTIALLGGGRGGTGKKSSTPGLDDRLSSHPASLPISSGVYFVEEVEGKKKKPLSQSCTDF